MSSSLPQELQSFLKEVVDEGLFDSEDAVIEHALWVLREQVSQYKRKRADLQQLLEEGLEDVRQGRVAELDLKAIEARAVARLDGEGSPCPGSSAPTPRGATSTRS